MFLLLQQKRVLGVGGGDGEAVYQLSLLQPVACLYFKVVRHILSAAQTHSQACVQPTMQTNFT
jgi:hypothetical protein